MKRRSILILTSLSASLLWGVTGCNPNNAPAEGKSTDSCVAEEASIADSLDEAEWDNWLDNYQAHEGTPAVAEVNQSATKSTATATAAPRDKAATKPLPSGQKIYVSTYGAQGQVWGYVIMNGASGRGTIHDATENTLSIKVTRHGNELFGIDQNGREYVFKI